jgi:hypothetical protein
MDELAAKCAAGTRSAEERIEYDHLIAADTLLATLQSKARELLRDHGAD